MSRTAQGLITLLSLVPPSTIIESNHSTADLYAMDDTGRYQFLLSMAKCDKLPEIDLADFKGK